MRIELLVLQRKEAYEGELGPEILAVVDETTQDENPEWWPQEIAKHKKEIGDEAERWGIVSAVIPEHALRAALHPHVDIKSAKGTPIEDADVVVEGLGKLLETSDSPVIAKAAIRSLLTGGARRLYTSQEGS